jgi:hypothetical protein
VTDEKEEKNILSNETPKGETVDSRSSKKKKGKEEEEYQEDSLL